MKRHVLVALAATLALGFVASLAQAACDFEHPQRARKFRSDMVQAFVSCGNTGGNAPNDTTEGNIPSCSPPETFNQQGGSPPNGWTWDENHGMGRVFLTAKNNKVPGNPAGSQDIQIRLRMRGVLDAGGPASGTGQLSTVARATLNDRDGDSVESGDDVSMTVVDFPANFPFTLTAGATNVQTSANVLLNGLGQPALPGCSSIEIIDVRVIDEVGNAFANIGLFLKDKITP